MHVPALLLSVALAASTPELPESGQLGWGINLQAPALGPAVAFAPGGTSVGFSLAGALQLDLGPTWALRLPVDFGGGLEELGRDRFATLAFSPGLVRRWRTSADDAWVPYVGAGLRLGVLVVGRNVLDVPLAVEAAGAAPVRALSRAADLDGWGDGDSDSENTEGRAGVGPELWAGGEWHPSRWFSLDLGAAYFYWRVYGRGVHVLSPRVGLRFSL